MSIPLAVASARKRVCCACVFCFRRVGQRWSRCGYGVQSIAALEGAPEVGDDWWLGSESVCPAGFWDLAIFVRDDRVYVMTSEGEEREVGSVDLAAYEAELAARQEARAEALFRERRRPGIVEHLREMKATLSNRSAWHSLVTLTRFMHLNPAWAQEIADELEITPPR